MVYVRRFLRVFRRVQPIYLEMQTYVSTANRKTALELVDGADFIFCILGSLLGLMAGNIIKLRSHLGSSSLWLSRCLCRPFFTRRIRDERLVSAPSSWHSDRLRWLSVRGAR